MSATCNRHYDCDAADAKWEVKYQEVMAERARLTAEGKRSWEMPEAPYHRTAEHCHDDDCEDCFGK